jgi:hypothetical protein
MAELVQFESRAREPLLLLFGAQPTDNGLAAIDYFAHKAIRKGQVLFSGHKRYKLLSGVKAGFVSPAIRALKTGEAQQVHVLKVEEV